MKNSLILLLFFSLHFASAQSVPSKVDTFTVAGSCGQCKERIEKAALKIKGVSAAEWNALAQRMQVNYDSMQTNLDQIEQAIAKVGHDTPKFKAKDATYNKLPDCCLYTREASATGIQTVRFTITGMTCAEGCAKGIEGALYKQKGVKSSEVNFDTQIATVIFDAGKISKADLIRVIESFNPGENREMKYRAEELK
jgi:copper ion binding protein